MNNGWIDMLLLLNGEKVVEDASICLKSNNRKEDRQGAPENGTQNQVSDQALRGGGGGGRAWALERSFGTSPLAYDRGAWNT